MRKLSMIVAIVAVAALFLSSCKSHERCPAYGKTGEHTDSSAKRV